MSVRYWAHFWRGIRARVRTGTGWASAGAALLGSGSVSAWTSRPQWCQRRRQCRRGTGITPVHVSVCSSAIAVWALVCQPWRVGSLPQMPGLSSLSADGAVIQRAVTVGRGQNPISRGPCCWAGVADVLPSSLCLLPEAP